MIFLYIMISIAFFVLSFLVAIWQDYLAFDYRRLCPEFFVDNQDYFYIVIIILFFTSIFIAIFSTEVNKYLILINIFEYFLKKYLGRIYSINVITKEIIKYNYKNKNKTFNKQSVESIKKYLKKERKNLI